MKINVYTLLIGLFSIGLLCQCNSRTNEKPNQGQSVSEVSISEQIAVKEDLASDRPSISIKAGQVVESPIIIHVNSEGKWGGFEGELGTIELFDEENHTIGICILSTSENWMVNGPVNYECEISYHAATSGNGRLVIKNNNPTGEVKHNKSFVIPVQYVEN